MHQVTFICGFSAESYLMPISFSPVKVSIPASGVLYGEAASYKFKGHQFLHQPGFDQRICASAQE